MPLDTSSYSLALLRLDGRRWNELRRIHAQISTQAAADGSSYLEMGNTKVVCTVTGPSEGRRQGGVAAAQREGEAKIEVEIGFAGFSGIERKRRGRGDNTISISLHILSQDGSLLAACLNAATLALVDAGIPMSDYLVSCTAGSTASYAANDEQADPLLDLNNLEEQELPFLTVGCLGQREEVSVLVMETKVQMSRLEAMLAVGVDGCKRVRDIMDGVVRAHGRRMLEATSS
ncbi:Exosome complex component ski6 [Lasiodiplodia hormozganensis]|uniref:Exosome complex component ski6 n=1 Tax=Lasiodiplodia hormozganensis TaxID=869390 RepID=A0AA40D8Z7_9PEZI|nr:Exosome complex component ski6 [Lasiodiplodia hormozganensis]